MSGNRQKNIEVLRTIAMLLVVLSHFLVWGTTYGYEVQPTFSNGSLINSVAFPFLSTLDSLGVICYVMITGYFMGGKTILRFDQLAKVWLPTFFYSVLIAVACFIIHKTSLKEILLSFVPIGSDQYWFVTKYVALVLIAPLLSIIINALDKKGMLILLIIFGLLSVTITCGVPYGVTFFKDAPNSVSTFVMIFLVGAYLRWYDLPEWINKHCWLIFAMCVLFQYIMGIIVNLVSDDILYGGFSTSYNAFSLFTGTALFVCFKNMKVGAGVVTRLLCTIAPYTFGVYLIHDNPHFRNILWNEILNPASFWGSPIWILLAIVVPIVILLICSGIDAIRAWLFKLVGIDKLIQRIKDLNIDFESHDRN